MRAPAITALECSVESRTDGRIVLHVRGDIDIATCDQLRDTIEPHLGPRRALVINLSAVEFMDSSGLHVLERARTVLVADRGSLVLQRPSTAVRRLLVAATAQDLLDAIEEPA